MANEHFVKPDYFNLITLEEARFILGHAEKQLNSLLSTSENIVGRIFIKTLAFILFGIAVSGNCQAQKRSTISIRAIARAISISTFGNDYLGYGFGTEVGYRIAPKWDLALSYSIGHQQLKPTSALAEFSEKFIHYVEPKITFHPLASLKNKGLRRYLGGLNVGIGPSFFSGTISREGQSFIYYDSLSNQLIRTSMLKFEKASDIGLDAILGYELPLGNFSIGVRAELANYSKEQGYFALGGYVGLRL